MNHRFGEESITDLILFELKKPRFPDFKVHDFSRRQEAISGADWEMYFVGNSGKSFGFRIQVKIIDSHVRAYPHLHYKTQCDSLIKNALNSPIALAPLYCFYSNWEPRNVTLSGNVRRRIRTIRDFGISVVSALQIKKLQPSRSRLDDLLPHMWPFYSLVCHPEQDKQDMELADRVFTNWAKNILTQSEFDELFPSSQDLSADDVERILSGQQIPKPFNQLPSYVRSLISEGETWLPQDLGRITVIMEREASDNH